MENSAEGGKKDVLLVSGPSQQTPNIGIDEDFYSDFRKQDDFRLKCNGVELFVQLAEGRGNQTIRILVLSYAVKKTDNGVDKEESKGAQNVLKITMHDSGNTIEVGAHRSDKWSTVYSQTKACAVTEEKDSQMVGEHKVLQNDIKNEEKMTVFVALCRQLGSIDVLDKAIGAMLKKYKENINRHMWGIQAAVAIKKLLKTCF
eukprot:jgi/Bigna1/91483/estExt_fgenesh1_pg.C_1020045